MGYGTLCEVCRDIQDKSVKLSMLIEEGKILEAQQLADKIDQLGMLASSMGQRMENRLNAYKTAIEALGFKRI